MAEHVHSGFNGASLTRREAEQRVAEIRVSNALSGARGWTQEIVQSGNGYKVIERSPGTKKK